MLIIQLQEESFQLYYKQNTTFSDKIFINEVKYIIDVHSKKNEGFIGFFDWLREDESIIVGVRMCLFEHHNYNSIFKELPYINSTNNDKWKEILFGENLIYDASLSGDQDFTNNYIYKSENGYLFTFGLDYLQENELESLMKYCKVLPSSS